MLIEIINYSQMKEWGVNSHGRRIRTSEGLTEIAQQQHMRRTKQVNNMLGKKADYIMFDVVQFMSKEYFGVIDAINECYRKMLKISKCKEVFRRFDENQCELLRAKSKQEFLNANKTYCCVTVPMWTLVHQNWLFDFPNLWLPTNIAPWDESHKTASST
jgi:hypothetical protein